MLTVVCIVVPSIFITVAPVAAINNTLGLSTDIFPYNKRIANVLLICQHIIFIKNDFPHPLLPVKNVCNRSIIDACGTNLLFKERFANLN